MKDGHFYATRIAGLCCLLGGCSAAGGGGIEDAGTDQPIDSLVEPQVALPQLADWKCAPGWKPETVGEKWGVGHTICLPPEQKECPAGQAQFLGETACRRIGTACPADKGFLPESEIKALAPGFDGRVLYVQPGVAFGDGSRASPWGRYRVAHDNAQAGDIIALSSGTFAEMFLAFKRLAIVGSCVEGSVIEPPAPVGDDFIAVGFADAGSGSLVTNLRVTGPRDGIWVGDKGHATAPFFIRKVEVLGVTGFGVTFNNGTNGELDEVVIRETDGPGPEYGPGLVVTKGASIDAARLVIERNRGFGILVHADPPDPPSSVVLKDVVVRDTAERVGEPENPGFGLSITKGSATVVRGLFERNHRTSVYVGGTSPSTLEMNDVTVRETVAASVPSPSGTVDRGVGLVVLDGSKAKVKHALFDDNAWAAIMVSSSLLERPTGTELELQSVVVRRTTMPDSSHGGALIFDRAAVVSLKSAYFEQNQTTGIRLIQQTVDDKPAVLTAEDLVVVETRSAANALFGRGIDVVNGAMATITRALLVGNREAAVLAIGDEGRPTPSVELRDITVSDTKPARCAELAEGEPLSCVKGSSVGGGGAGISSAGGKIAIERFESRDNAQSGLQVCRDGQMTASHGSVHHNVLGAHIRVDDYDLSTIVNDSIRYYDNDTNVGGNELPLPETGALVRW